MNQITLQVHRMESVVPRPGKVEIGFTDTADGNLSRLRERDLRPKRSLARREFALGLEALARFVAREQLPPVHERVFAVLAMESEPVDPWL